MFSARKFNQTVILYFVTVILGLLFSALTSCTDASAFSPAFSTPIIQRDGQPTNPPVETVQPEATETTCAATTKAGTKCTRKVQAGQTYCWQHGGQTKTEAAGTAVETSGTCGATTKAGTACKNRVKGGGKCHLHRAG